MTTGRETSGTVTGGGMAEAAAPWDALLIDAALGACVLER